jgi:type IV fimbrial biogenesis protein FimT
MLSRAQARRCEAHLRALRGMTLIELMVTLTIMAICAALVAPSFAQITANYRVRSGAETIIHALNYARAEAVKRNTAVRFTLSGAGSGWSISQVSPGVVLQSRADADAQGISAASSNSAVGVTFLPTGLVDTTDTWLTQVTVSSAVGATDSRRIVILGGGLVRMCDPAITATNDPRRC